MVWDIGRVDVARGFVVRVRSLLMGTSLTARAGCLLVAAGALFVMMWPVLQSEFGMIDDHQLIDTMPGGRALSIVDIPSRAMVATGEPVGRFRPGYWAAQAVEMSIAGQHPSWWYLDRMILAAIVLIAVFVVASRIVGPLPAAVISLLPFSGPQVEAWLRLGAQEAYAMPLAGLGLAFIAVRALNGRVHPAQVAPGYVLLLLAAQVKENFITLAPAAVVVSVGLTGLRHLRRADWIVAGGVLVMTLIDLVLIASKIHRYGNVYPQERTAWAVLQHLRYVFETQTKFALLAVGMSAVVLLVARSRRRLTVVVAAFVAVGSLLVLPQSVLLAGTGREGRYLYPLALLPCVVWALTFWGAATLPRWKLPVTAGLLVALIIPLGSGFALGRDTALGNALRTRGFQQQLEAIRQRAVDSGNRTVVLEPALATLDYEPVASLATYLTKVHGLTVMTLPAPPVDGNPYYAMLNRELALLSRHGGDGFTPYDNTNRCVTVSFGLESPTCTVVYGFRS